MTSSESPLSRESLWGTGGVEEAMQAFASAIARAKDAGSPSFESAMTCLVMVVDRDALDRVASARKSRFWSEVAHALAPLAADVGSFVRLSLYKAENSGEGDLPYLCVRRSAVELLRDEPSTAAVVVAIDTDDLDELDNELRRIAKYGSVPMRFIPRGIPETHWWWWYPEPAPRATEAQAE